MTDLVSAPGYPSIPERNRLSPVTSLTITGFPFSTTHPAIPSPTFSLQFLDLLLFFAEACITYNSFILSSLNSIAQPLAPISDFILFIIFERTSSSSSETFSIWVISSKRSVSLQRVAPSFFRDRFSVISLLSYSSLSIDSISSLHSGFINKSERGLSFIKESLLFFLVDRTTLGTEGNALSNC
ncbi:hypothetical protein BMS3Bbin07_01526 [bacterium BMS3Bbin07]|nr:hypothetical protein BMS3Bbin07_01526 [bacterium BMS3Bbin07]